MKKHAAPIIAAILLLLPVLYVGNYLALVMIYPDPFGGYEPFDSDHMNRLFWPLEQIDRTLRRGQWNR